MLREVFYPDGAVGETALEIRWVGPLVVKLFGSAAVIGEGVAEYDDLEDRINKLGEMPLGNILYLTFAVQGRVLRSEA